MVIYPTGGENNNHYIAETSINPGRTGSTMAKSKETKGK
jgi:hypothetical protein